MSKELEIGGIEIAQADWEATPERVKSLVSHLVATIAQMSEQITHLSERVEQLEEQCSKNSKNSSKPPSSDGFDKPPPTPDKRDTKRSRGGQKGHQGHSRQLYSIERCDEVIEHYPTACKTCGEALSGADRSPYRHQIVELPSIEPTVIEHRLHRLSCPHCGTDTRACLPPDVSASGYGERLSAIVALLSGVYRQSHYQVASLLQDVLNISISSSSVNRLRCELSEAVSPSVEAAHDYVQNATVLHSDETSFKQGNGDGRNPNGKRGWLWVLVTPCVSFFSVALSRSQSTAQTLIGKSCRGIVVSDRYSAYNWLALEQRQLCWAHLKRDLTAIAQRSGLSHEIGAALLRRERRLFRLWHQVRDGTLTPAAFAKAVEPLRRGFKQHLEAATQLPIDAGEKTPLAKTVRTCQKILQVESALWTFITQPEVEPTNNAAERALRPAVIWRRTSFGSQSLAGSQFVARMMTVSTSLKAQRRDVLGFLMQACRAARFGQTQPSLIPLTAQEPTTSIQP